MTRPLFPSETIARIARVVLPPVSVVVLAIAVWAAITRLTGLPTFILPSPTDVVDAARRAEPRLTEAIASTLGSTLIGLSIATALGIVVAAMMDFLPIVKRAFYPLLVASQTVQILAVAPLLVIWLGFGRAPTIAVVVLFTFFPMTISTVDGLSATNPDYVSLLRAMGARRRQIWMRVRLPAAAPSFFSGLRLSVTYSVVAATIGEWIGGSVGLGLYMLRSKNALQTDQVFLAMMITTAISISLFAIVFVVERIVLPWNRATEREQWMEKGIY